MGASLAYWTTDPVSDDVAEKIREEVAELRAHRQWWAEAIELSTEVPGKNGHLAGEMGLFLLGYEDGDGMYVEVDPDDDAFMAYRDMRFIVGRLRRWSEEYGLSWELQLEGEPLGTIEDGKSDTALKSFLEELGRSGGATFDLAKDGARADEIHHRYATRW